MKVLKRASTLVGAFALLLLACGADKHSETSRESGGATAETGPDRGVGGYREGNADPGVGGSADQGVGGETSGGAPASKEGSGGTTSMGGEPDELPTDINFVYDPTNDVELEACAELQIESTKVLLDMFIILVRRDGCAICCA